MNEEELARAQALIENLNQELEQNRKMYELEALNQQLREIEGTLSREALRTELRNMALSMRDLGISAEQTQAAFTVAFDNGDIVRKLEPLPKEPEEPSPELQRFAMIRPFR